ncbi:class I lanthipeptide [uncultured Dokdonia sp.]|uniref:class I lanthipeptide n=1 Tax=uncultured Dokdonia sp. TaxID=575653 RepID=UPI0026091555|nr:class I lanthipeptide [uncultured Dokdonia sp.]
MKKKSIKGLSLNKDVISSFNRMHIQGGGRVLDTRGCRDTAQSFCGYATCVTDCEAATASVETVCCN